MAKHDSVLLNIGRKVRAEGPVALLLECHERIRSFTALALAVGTRADASPEECREASARCLRYFVEALPLHVADEEECLLPRLRGRDAELDAALRTMAAEHAEHTRHLTELLGALEEVGRTPMDEGARERLVRVAKVLMGEFTRHLSAEEQLIFPKVATLLSPQEQDVIVAEFRARRRSAPPPSQER